MKSVSEITNTIIKLESTNELFKWDINGVFVWEIIRYKIYIRALSENENKIADGNVSIFKIFMMTFNKVKNKFGQYINAIIYNPYFDSKKADVIIFESSRKLLFNEIYIDPHTKFLCDELIAQKKTIAKFQSSYNYDKLAKKESGTKHLDLVYLISAFKNKLKPISLSFEQNKKIQQLEDLFYNEFEIHFNFRKLIENEIKSFQNNSIFFDSLFKKKKPNEIFLTNFCDKTALIAMAKKNQIKVIDIQHGLISSKDIIYNYPGVPEGSLNYFPDVFYAWAKIWEKISKIPLTTENIVDYGNKYLDNQKENYSHISKNTNMHLVISQPGLTRQIAIKILKNIKRFKEDKIVYKLHPIEYEYAYDYSEVKSLIQLNNVSFVERETDLYKLLAEAGTVLGVYSTALVEALSFNCKVLLIDLPGVEMMEPFADMGLVNIYEEEVAISDNV